MVLMNPQPYKVFVRLGGPDAPTERNYDLVLPENTMMAMPVGSFMFGMRLGTSTQVVAGTAVTVVEFLKDEPAPAFGSVPLSSVIADVSGSTVNVGNTPGVNVSNTPNVEVPSGVNVNGGTVERTQLLRTAANWIAPGGIGIGGQAVVYIGTYDNINASEDIAVVASGGSDPFRLAWYHGSSTSGIFIRNFYIRDGIPFYARLPFFGPNFLLLAAADQLPQIVGVGMAIYSRKVPEPGFVSYLPGTVRAAFASPRMALNTLGNNNYNAIMTTGRALKGVYGSSSTTGILKFTLAANTGDQLPGDPWSGALTRALPLGIVYANAGEPFNLDLSAVMTSPGQDTLYCWTGPAATYLCFGGVYETPGG
jgi:hypothetical protein